MKRIYNFCRKNFLLGLILTVSFALRIWGIDYGRPFTLHPDETKIIEPALSMSMSIKASLLGKGQYPYLYPDFFFYPHFLYYLLVAVIQIMKVLLLPLGLFSSIDKFSFYLTARLLSAIAGTLTVFATYRVARLVSRDFFASKKNREFFSLISALFLAVSFLHVRQSHYYTGDVFATLFSISSLYFFIKFLKKDLSGDFFLSFFLVGLGASTKYYPIILLPVFMFILLLKFFPQKEDFIFFVKKALTAVSVSVFSFLLFTPHAVTHYGKFLETMKISSERSRGGFMGALSANPFYYIHNKDISVDDWWSGNDLIDGAGFLIFAFFILGFALCFSKTLKGEREKSLTRLSLLLVPAFFYLFFSLYLSKIVRWLTVLAPFIALFSSFAFVYFLSKRIKHTFLMLVLLAVFSFNQVFKDVRFDSALSRKDTRVSAYEFINENIPVGSGIIFESIGIHDLVESGKYKFTQISHPRYNTKGEFKRHAPPDIDALLYESSSKYMVINGQNYLRYSNPSSRKYFAQVSSSWRQFYSDIDSRFKRVAYFDPLQSKSSGPKIIIYVK